MAMATIERGVGPILMQPILWHTCLARVIDTPFPAWFPDTCFPDIRNFFNYSSGKLNSLLVSDPRLFPREIRDKHYFSGIGRDFRRKWDTGKENVK
jgi:hypothetical protein